MSKVKTTEIATTGSGTVTEMLKKLTAKMETFKHIAESVFKTRKKLEEWDLDKITDVRDLILMYSSVSAREEAYNKAQEDLGISKAPIFKLEGSTKEEWKADIFLRYQILEQKDTLDKLKALKTKGEEFIDKEERKQAWMEEMNRLLVD